MLFIFKQKQSAAAGEQQCVAAAADRYSPLGALYNMRPPNGGAGTAVTTQQRNQADDNNVDDGKQQQQLTVGGGVKVVTSPTSSGSGSGINANQQVAKEQSPSDASNTNKLMWTPERLISSMPPGTCRLVLFLLLLLYLSAHPHSRKRTEKEGE